MTAIYGSIKKLPLGRIDPRDFGMMCIFDEHGIDHEPIPMFIVREATREEYLAECPEHEKSRAELPINNTPYYYEISLD
jgi:hypothetical protein